ncbi:MAG: 6-pyruvoyl-tetrahydropterin synthase-related protein, partial [Hyphomicrobium sp.]
MEGGAVRKGFWTTLGRIGTSLDKGHALENRHALDNGHDPATGGASGLAAVTGLRHPSQRLAFAAIFAIWLTAFSRWIWQDETVPWDAKTQFYAFFRFLAKSLHDGTSPFWNPYHYGGHPSIADPQSLIFSPLFLLWAALDPAPSMRAFDLIVYAHLLIGGLAIAGYGHRRGWPVAASILAAAVFMFGGAAAGRLNHTGIISSYGLFPLAMLTLELALERRSRLLAIAFAAIASVIALGRNQVALLLCFVLLALAIRHILVADSPLRYLRQRAGCLALM